MNYKKYLEKSKKVKSQGIDITDREQMKLLNFLGRYAKDKINDEFHFSEAFGEPCLLNNNNITAICKKNSRLIKSLMSQFTYQQPVRKKEKLVSLLQDVRAIDNSAINCNFVNLQFPTTIQLFNAITGFNYDKKTLLECGERISNLKRLINCKLDIMRMDDPLPKIIRQPLDSGTTSGVHLDLEENLKTYYRTRKWNWDTGRPSEEKLKELQIM